MDPTGPSFSAVDFAAWMAIAAFLVMMANNGLALFDRLTSRKADKPAGPADHLITQDALASALAPIAEDVNRIDGALSDLGTRFVTQASIDERLSRMNGKIETVRTEVLAAVEKSQEAGEKRVERLETHLQTIDESRNEDTKKILKDIGGLMALITEKKK